MEPYSKYIENESFLSWVYNPTPETTRFWQDFILKNPQEKEVINTLKGILIDLKTEEAKLSEKEKEEILTKLLNKIDNKNKPKKVYNLVKRAYKYAAILVLVLIATTVFVNNNFKKTNDFIFDNINEMSLDSVAKTNTQLIFESGKPLLIDEKKSLIEYTKLGQVVLNEKDTIIINKKNEGKILLFNKLIVPFGKRSKVILSDGSVVHLNAGTTFVFPENFDSKERAVFLSGEAFFEVAANKEKPFIVKTIEENFSIEVLGTKFNVSAYPIDSDILTVLTEGKVAITEKNIFRTQKTILKPGQLASWNKNEERVDVKDVNTDNYTLWTSGLLYFESASIVNIVRKIERFYNVSIVFDNMIEAKHVNVSGKLDLNDKIEQTLENLTITTKFKFEIINNSNYVLK
ncbi:FecR family protein [Flavivirga jejuensis]|uniref:FecR domain-containing protein n=1 Tax=Flavivirga jejuensis TaxID=870487 RepID=A0ABT8WMB1_9FLAO|nr:FecR domain-containing protein [Flavivirga jejuensis]MDO5974296.1 FecR domain-containing protein [Flavivirga jejuensis]